jgi:hypothetical protein
MERKIRVTRKKARRKEGKNHSYSKNRRLELDWKSPHVECLTAGVPHPEDGGRRGDEIREIISSEKC